MADIKRPKTWTTPGRGRKVCPSCGTYVASRSKGCPCGHTFEVKTRQRSYSERSKAHEGRAKARLEDEGDTSDKRPHLCTPAGKCPLELTGTGMATVQFWMQDLAKLHPAYRLMPSCFKYWAKSYFSVGSEEYATVVRHIDHCATFPTRRA